MLTPISQIAVVLTSFAYRDEYLPELEGLLVTVKRHHPDWAIVAGRGPVARCKLPTLDVESPVGRDQWSLPVPLDLDGSVDDWRKINKMKAWWIYEVFRNLGNLAGRQRRVLWIDADARLNGPLDIELDPEAEVIAGPWWRHPKHPDHESIAGGFLLFQGSSNGPVEDILTKWSDTCVGHIQELPDPPIVPWGDGDMEVLNIVLNNHPPSSADYHLMELDAGKYLGIVDQDGTPAPGALVDQWMMARKMKWPVHRERDWPPPEDVRQKLRTEAINRRSGDVGKMRTPLTIEQTAKKSRRQVWSIGIFSGETLADLQPVPGVEMPVISAKDVTDVPTEFVADPFMIQADNTWYMFFEIMNAERDKGEIGLATSSNGLEWKYQQSVLRDFFHLSYPYVFCAGKEYFMIPETFEAKAMKLYQADAFPIKWSCVGTLLEGPWVDSSIFFFDGRWWVFTNPVAPDNQVLELFYANDIKGPWQRHPMSPLVNDDNRMARGAGRVIMLNNKPIRFTQDCFPRYGTSVRAFEISVLTPSSYAERELEFSPILSPSTELWRQQGMHHIDPHFVDGRWFACVDGWRSDDGTALLRGEQCSKE
jgi:hypothetical protein